MSKKWMFVTFLLLLVIPLISYINTGFDTIPSRVISPSDEQLQLNVLLLSYARSGSSFTGEMLASCDNCSYFFEPLYTAENLQPNATKRAFQTILAGIFSCNSSILHRLGNQTTFWILRKFGRTYGLYNHFNSPDDVTVREYCERDKLKVTKTIRMRLADTVPLLDRFTNLKIVHLVRDPRAVLYSTQKIEGIWASPYRSAISICSSIATDIKEGEKLPKHRYHFVQYEKLVLRPIEEWKKIFKFLDQPFTKAAKTFLSQHTHATRNQTGYFTTYRDSTFDPFEWTTKMSAQRRQYIEHICEGVLSKLPKIHL